MTMPPGPVFFLFFGTQLAKIAMRIAMIFAGPLVVVDHFVMVPSVVVAIVGVIDAVVVMLRASRAEHSRH